MKNALFLIDFERDRVGDTFLKKSVTRSVVNLRLDSKEEEDFNETKGEDEGGEKRTGMAHGQRNRIQEEYMNRLRT